MHACTHRPTIAWARRRQPLQAGHGAGPGVGAGARRPLRQRLLAALRHHAARLARVWGGGGSEPAPRLRPVDAQDLGAMGRYLMDLGTERRRLRFHGGVNPSERLLSQMTRVDGRSQLALVAVVPADEGELIVGEACCQLDRSRRCAEFAISVAQLWEGSGLARALLEALLRSAAASGMGRMACEVLADNARMITLLARTGFEPEPVAEAGVQRWQISLAEPR